MAIARIFVSYVFTFPSFAYLKWYVWLYNYLIMLFIYLLKLLES